MKHLQSSHVLGRGISLSAAALLLNVGHCNPTEPARVAGTQSSPSAIYGFGGASKHKANEESCSEKERHRYDNSCRNFNFYGDFLYWKANEDGLEYGSKMIASPIIGQSSTTRTKLLDLDFQWAPGFTVGFGYAFDFFDCWALDLNWTHIRNRAHGTTSAAGRESQVGSVDTIISPWVNLLFSLRAGSQNAIAKWRLTYDTVDLVMEKSVHLSKLFSITPYFGFRGVNLDQTYKVRYQTIFLNAENAPRFSRDVFFRGRNDYTAGGLRGGTELLCHLSKNWHLFSKLTGNFHYGKFRVSMRNLNDQGLGEGSIPPRPINFFASEHLWRVRLSFEEAIGLGWETFFSCERYRLRARAAYELSQWLNQNELFYTFYFRGQDTISSVPIRNQGNLSFQGIRASLQFDF